ncbi:MAG: RloB domain-containing protein, partial [Gammaproteobacteria bacterium]
RRRHSFDKIYCVFDKDSHASYARALDALVSATPKDTFFTINSVPFFEYWLLLHSKRPFNEAVMGYLNKK